MTNLQQLLAITEAQHKHLCPRQVLGVRMGMYAAELLGFDLPQQDKRIFTFVETDGCFADGVSAATGCTLGHRTLRLVDHGKIAAVFVDTKTEYAVRIHPSPESRSLAACCSPDARSRWHAQLAGYQVLPCTDLFVVQEVDLSISVAELVSRPGVRVTCSTCGEEIINEREVMVDGLPYCKHCAGEHYFTRREEAAWSTFSSDEPSVICAYP